MTISPSSVEDHGATQGWIVYTEWDVRRCRRIIFVLYRRHERLLFAIDGEAFDAEEASVALTHKKGLFLSELTVTINRKKHLSRLYITPWWRYIFDDGMFPADMTPLAEMARILQNSKELRHWVTQWQTRNGN